MNAGGRLIQNFRGMRAAVLLPADRNRATIAQTLNRLGLSVLPLDPAQARTEPFLLDGAELILFDADLPEGELPPLGTAGEPPVPLIAVIGLEAPSRLQRAFDFLPVAVLHKPVRTAGIFTALFFAANEHRRQQELHERLRLLEERHAARRFVVKAVLVLMRRRGIDDEQAYRLLRKESMRQRLTIEQLAVQIVASAEPAPDALKA